MLKIKDKIIDDFKYHTKNNSILIETVIFAFSLMIVLMYYFENNNTFFALLKSISIEKEKIHSLKNINTELLISLSIIVQMIMDLLWILIFKNIYLILIYVIINNIYDILGEIYYLYNFIYFSLAFIIYWSLYLKNSDYLSKFKNSLLKFKNSLKLNFYLSRDFYLRKDTILYFIILLLIYFECPYYCIFFLYLLIQERFFNRENKVSVLQNPILHPKTYLLSIIIIFSILVFCIEFGLLLHLILSILFMLFILFFFNHKEDTILYKIGGYILCYIGLRILSLIYIITYFSKIKY